MSQDSKIKEGVDSIMGGQVLELRSERDKREGYEKAKAEFLAVKEALLKENSELTKENLKLSQEFKEKDAIIATLLAKR